MLITAGAVLMACETARERLRIRTDQAPPRQAVSGPRRQLANDHDPQNTAFAGLFMAQLSLAMASDALRMPHGRAASLPEIRSIALGAPDRWDYLTWDPASHRVFAAHQSTVTVVDADRSAIVGQIPVPGANGIAVAPRLHKGWAGSSEKPCHRRIRSRLARGPEADSVGQGYRRRGLRFLERAGIRDARRPQGGDRGRRTLGHGLPHASSSAVNQSSRRRTAPASCT